MKKKCSAYSAVRVVMAALAVLFLLGLWLVPAMRGLRSNFFVWFFFAVYVLVTLFVWGIGSKKNRTVGEGFDPVQGNKDLYVTREHLKERSKWHFPF